MNAATKKQLKADLKAVLEKYNVKICFTCSESSDTHGLRNDRIIILDDKGNVVVNTDGWHLGAANLRR